MTFKSLPNDGHKTHSLMNTLYYQGTEKNLLSMLPINRHIITNHWHYAQAHDEQPAHHRKMKSNHEYSTQSALTHYNQS